MRMILRPFQAAIKAALYDEWAKDKVANLLAVLPTGAGKTVLFADIIYDEPGAVCVMAHRGELVTQISLALARNGVRHRIIGTDTLRRACTALHLAELGANYIDANSRVAAASVDSLRSLDANDPWFASVALIVGDEGHHFLRENKWGKACAMFPNARILLVTATPCRADGKGLGSHADGLVDKMIVGPDPRQLINMGFLTDYRIFCPPNDFNRANIDTSAGGDFSPTKLKKETRRAGIVGDVVKHYLRIAPGKLAIAFAVDIEDATTMAANFRDAGVPAEVVSSKTPALLRAQIMRDFRARRILLLVNVDLFGEGFDLPAIEVVIMARATESYALFAQMFGRVLRLMEGKEWAIVIDHVGNVLRHGLPDKPRTHSLDRRQSGAKKAVDEDVIPLTHCVECTQPYERIYSTCPHCLHTPEPAGRSSPEFVDGDLHELTADVLAIMRGNIAAFDNPFVPIPPGVGAIAAQGIKNKALERQQAQGVLRNTIAVWAGWHKRDFNRTDREINRLFYLAYGVDILTAQTLKPKEANELTVKLQARLDVAQIKAA